MKMNTKMLMQAAIIASTYAVLTIAIAPLSYGVMQFRVSEALTVLPMFTPAAIPGLFIGCIVANIISPMGVIDMILGSLATLIAGFCSYKLREKRWLVPLPPVIANGIVIGAMLHYVYGVPVALPLCMLWVALGEALACYGLGYPLSRILEKYKGIFKQ